MDKNITNKGKDINDEINTIYTDCQFQRAIIPQGDYVRLQCSVLYYYSVYDNEETVVY